MDIERIYRTIFGEDAEPDCWQLDLARREWSQWPTVLIAPTGFGKTAAVTLGWASRRLQEPESTHRRLIWCLPMRVLVEQTAKSVKGWFEKLEATYPDSKLLPGPSDVHILMGGSDDDRWLDYPERPSVIIGTQDMLLSRALMRGYASNRAKWPVEFGLMHRDSQWIYDEVQLMGVGRSTSAQLQAFRDIDTNSMRHTHGLTHTPSRSMWLSATLESEWLQTVDFPAPPPERVLRVPPIGANERLDRIASAKKRLSPLGFSANSQKTEDLKNYISLLADTIVAEHLGSHNDQQCKELSSPLTIAILNRVDRAQTLYKEISSRLMAKGNSSPSLTLVHSRFLPIDRQRTMNTILETGPKNSNGNGKIVISTQAIEAGVDISASTLFTELAPWSSLIQRFGRANRYGERHTGACIKWIDLLCPPNAEDFGERAQAALALPYTIDELTSARDRLLELSDVSSVNLGTPSKVEPSSHVIRRKDLQDLFDTDPDLSGFDIDVSQYVRDTGDNEIHVFWRKFPIDDKNRTQPSRSEICAVSILSAREWIDKVRKKIKTKECFYRYDVLWSQNDSGSRKGLVGWARLEREAVLWPGMIILADWDAGGYDHKLGFTGDLAHKPMLDFLFSEDSSSSIEYPGESNGQDEDVSSESSRVVTLEEHLQNVSDEATHLCNAMQLDNDTKNTIICAARWHDVGKSHCVFQKTMKDGIAEELPLPDTLLAKTVKKRIRHKRPYFRHELASALAYLSLNDWSEDADLIAYLIASHHGKLRMNIRPLPNERPPKEAERYARGILEGEDLPAVNLDEQQLWPGGQLTLTIMELGYDTRTKRSWTERTRKLLSDLGPFELAWLESLLRVADWRASKHEARGPQNES